jgi:hypothetical protein
MLKTLLTLLIQTLLSLATPELLKKLADSLLDFVENFVAGTASEIDDALVLPLCDKIRSTFGIPDND